MMNEFPLDRISDKIKAESISPKHIQISPTNRCNINCIFCWRRKEDTKTGQEMGGEKFLNVIRNSCRLKPNILTITGGGEPLLKGEFLGEAASIIGSYDDVKGELITNGVLLNEKMIRDLVRFEFEKLKISLNAPDASTNDFLMGSEGVFREAVRSLIKVREIKEEFQKSLPRLEVSMVATKYNFDRIREMFELTKIFNASLELRTVIEPTGYKEDLSIPSEKKKKFLEEVEEVEKMSQEISIDFRKSFNPDFFLDKDRSSELKNKMNKNKLLSHINNSDMADLINKFVKCKLPFLEMNIFADGHVAPCGHIFFTGGEISSELSSYLESIYEKNIEEIWYGEKFNRMRTLSLLGELPYKCKDCHENLVGEADNIENDVLDEI